ncbi:MAG: methionyl aminopeptidase [Limisphaerales bacterium]
MPLEPLGPACSALIMIIEKVVIYKTISEIERLRVSALLVSSTLAEVAKQIRPGVRTSKLDEIAEAYIRDNGAEPGFKGYRGFPWTLCISVNDAVVHGMPSDYEVKPGDLLSIDCGVLKDGFYGDSAYTFLVGETTAEIEALLAATKVSLYKGIEVATAGGRIGDIGYAVQQYTEKERGYGVVRDLVGHGVGKSLHEEPEVRNYGRRGQGLKLQEGLVIAIEPMINLGTREVKQLSDGWTISTADGKPSAHYEHMIAVRKGEADILSSFEPIEEVERSNEELGCIELTQTVNG